MRLYHGTNNAFHPDSFEIGRASTTVPVGGGSPVPVRNSAAFFALDSAVAAQYGARVIEAELRATTRVLDLRRDHIGSEQTVRTQLAAVGWCASRALDDWRNFEYDVDAPTAKDGRSFRNAVGMLGYDAIVFEEGDNPYTTIAIFLIGALDWVHARGRRSKPGIRTRE